MQKLSRSNLKFIRLIRHLRDHAGLDIAKQVRFVVLGSCDCYCRIEMGPKMMPIIKDLQNVHQLALVMEKLGV